MSSGPNSRFWNTIGFRLSAGYLALFVVSVSLIFAAINLILERTLEAHDRELIQESFSHYVAVYDASGLKGLEAEIAKSSSAAELNQLLLRVQDAPSGKLIFYHRPKDIAEYDDVSIQKQLTAAGEQPGLIAVRSKQDSDDVLEIKQGHAADGHTIQVGKNSEDREDFLEQFRNVFLLITLPCLLLGLLGAFFISSRFLSPIRQLILAIQKIDRGETNVQATEGTGQDELSELSRLFNKNWAKNQKLVNAMRQSLDMVAHDLRTPLTRVRGYADEAFKQKDPTKKDESIMECILNLDETIKLLNLMMDISETESGALRLNVDDINCGELLRSVKDLYAMIAEDKQIEILVQADPALRFRGDKRMKQALANLLDNALKYSRPDSQVIMSAFCTPTQLVFEVKDEGPGIPEEHRAKIFERYDRGATPNWQPGLGLGLTLVASIVHAHDGSVEVADAKGVGTAFRILLPL